MTSTQQGQKRDLALTIITAIVGAAAIAFAIAATTYMFAL